MSKKIGIPLFCVFLAAGCATSKSPKGTPSAATKAASTPAAPSQETTGVPSMTVTNGNQVITLADQAVGAVYSVNSVARFAILNYGLNPLPPLDQRLNAYRQGVKVGELRVSGPVLGDNIAADILAGDVRKGDQVRRD